MASLNFDPENITRRLYEAVSGPPGNRNWTVCNDLFHPDARLVRTGQYENGKPFQTVMSHDEYKINVDELLHTASFEEEEVEQHSVVFGNVAEIRSVYRYRFESPDESRSGLGINLITLVRFEQGWQVMSIVWDNEREDLRLPDSL